MYKYVYIPHKDYMLINDFTSMVQNSPIQLQN